MATPLMSLPDQSRGKRKYVVPWKSREDFLKIYQDIYGEDEDLKLKAVNRITTWKSRAGSKLSVAVENTGRLFENILRHKSAVRENRVHKDDDILRSCYGVAIIRFVNFVTERGQTKAVAQPVHVLAKQFGIPEWIVRIRHDATHNMYPSLDMLSSAACWAVQYLKEEFWRYQTHEYRRPVGKKYKPKGGSRPIGEVKQALLNFKKARFEDIKSDEVGQNITDSEVKKLKLYVNENSFKFVTCLLENGVLIPLPHELVKFETKEEDVLNQQVPSLPPKLREFWRPVVAMLISMDEIGVLARMAAYSLTDEDCLRNHLIAGWLDFILQGTSKTPHSEGMDCLLVDKTSLPMKALLYVCLDHTNKFTFHLLKHLLNRKELGQDAYTKLSELTKAAVSPSSPSASIDQLDSDGEEEVQGEAFSAKDVREASFSHNGETSPFPVAEKEIPGSADVDEIGWKICTDFVDWSTVPLGIIPSLEEDETHEENSGEGDEEGEEDDDDDNDHTSDEDDDDEDDERHARDWKRSGRKRSFEGEEEDGSSGATRTSPKRSTYIVKDTELL